ncbi:putative phage abortive infection protein, partial [Bacteroidales bacterium OttesenSCG-928-I14]|nr:putative phage abortive infection protein [Bacteroidales bacterium OttesenSCG-928-I14]
MNWTRIKKIKKIKMKRMKNWWNKKSSWLVPLLAFIACFGVWFLAPLLSHWYITVFYNFNDIVSNTEIISESKTLLEKRALWGDSYGSINALISAFAFAGVIVSMYLQRKDLQLQRDSLGVQKDELIRNTNELASQRQEFETQNKTMSLQRFENTFFNMLNLQQEIVSNLKFRYREKGVSRDNNVANGREVFEALYVKMDVRVFRTNQSNKIDLEEAITGGIHNAIARNIDNYYLIQEKSILDHYFRNLYRIIKFVNDSVFLNNYEKYSYVAMVRATLS